MNTGSEGLSNISAGGIGLFMSMLAGLLLGADMSDIASGVLGVLERIPKIAFQISMPLIFIGGGLKLAIDAGFIAKTAFHGYIADAAPVLVTIGIATLVIGVAVAVLRWLGRLPEWIAAKSEGDKQRTTLYQNMRFLPADNLFVVLNMLNQPGCRCPSHGEINTIRTLERYNLISAENFYSSATQEGTMIRVAQALADDIRQAKKTVRELLLAHGNDPATLEDDQVVSNRALKILNGERQQEKQRLGGF